MDGITQFPGQASEPTEPSAGPTPEPAPIKPEPPISQPQVPQSLLLLPQPRRRTWLWVVLGVLVFIILVMSLLVYYGAPPPEEVEKLQETQNLTAIEKDLNQLKLDNLDAELKDIDKELQ